MLFTRSLEMLFARWERHHMYFTYCLWPLVAAAFFYVYTFVDRYWFLYVWGSRDNAYLERIGAGSALCWRVLDRLVFNDLWVIFGLLIYMFVLLFGQLFKHHKNYYKFINISAISILCGVCVLMSRVSLPPLGA